jgi:hypothetical protein
MSDTVLSLWTVYDHPSDHPAYWVARRWEIRREAVPTGDLLKADTLDELRGLLPPGLDRLPREPGDDPAIVETWL